MNELLLMRKDGTDIRLLVNDGLAKADNFSWR